MVRTRHQPEKVRGRHMERGEHSGIAVCGQDVRRRGYSWGAIMIVVGLRWQTN